MISITNAAKEPHITPLQDSMWHRGMAGIDSCVFNFFENFAAEVSSNNSIKIRSGIGMIQGRYFCVEPSTYDEVTIANGTQGEKRKDLIVCRWTVNEEQKVQSGDWVVIQGTPTTGTPVAPSYTAGDLDAGDLIADMPFYEVTLDGINVTGVAQKFANLGGIKKTVNIPSDALKFLTGNGNGDTPTNWGKAGPGMAYISTEGMLANQPMKYGWLMNYTAGGSLVAQQFIGLDGNSPVYYRSGNSSGWSPGSKSWVRSLDEKNGVAVASDITTTSGNRTMRTIKYGNGDMEQYMWASNISMTFAANGNRFVDYVTFNTLEKFAEPEKIIIDASCISNAGIAFLYANAFENDNKKAVCFFDCPTAGARTIEHLTIYAKGKWK
jgi:hypothetical protein